MINEIARALAEAAPDANPVVLASMDVRVHSAGVQDRDGGIWLLATLFGGARCEMQKSSAVNFHRSLPLPSRVSYENKSRRSGGEGWWLLMTRTCRPAGSLQKSGLSAVGTSEYVPGYHSGFSAQTSSGHSSKARRNVTVADQGIVKTPASSTVSWICSPHAGLWFLC